MAEGGFSPEIQKHIDALPPAAKEFVTGPELGKAVQIIGTKHQLHIDQIGALDAEVFAAAIGITELEEFAENAEGALGIDAQKSAALTKDVNEGIFLKIRDIMKGGGQKITQGSAPQVPLATQTPAPISVQSHEVVMPSSTKPVVMPSPIPTTTPVVAPVVPPPAPASASKPALAPNLGNADAILSEKKVTPPAAAPTPVAPAIPAAPATPAASPMPKVDPAQPQNYKADPYREPVE